MMQSTVRRLTNSFLAATLAIAVLAGSAIGARQRTRELELARGGRTGYVIVLPESPSETERFAAAELSRYLERLSGAKFPVERGTRVPARAIRLGSPADLGQPALAGEEYRISTKGEQILLAGARDRATLFAAYDLLTRLGCRWLAPELGFYEGSGEFVPRRERLMLALPEGGVERPALAFRKLYVEEGHSHNAANLAQLAEWMPKLRYNTLVIPTDYQGRGQVRWDNWREAVTPELRKRDLTIEVGGHGYQNFLNAQMEGGKYFKEHLEWFGQDAAGQRVPAMNRVFCTSNPQAVRFVTDRFLEYVKARPEIRIFDFWPPDGARWCECAGCAALGNPSDRQALLLNQVRAATAKVRPDLRLECLAYQTSIFPPEKATLDREVLLDYCPINQSFDSQIDDPAAPRNAEYAKGISAWRKAFQGDISVYSYYRKYAWRSLPVIIPHYMQRDLRWYGTLPVQGVSTYAEPGDWGTYELNHYVLGNLAWSPGANVDALVREFTDARFGPAAPAARAVFATLEEVVRRDSSIPNSTLKPADQLAAARKELQKALDTLKAGSTGAPGGEKGARADSPAGVAAAVSRLGLAVEYAARDLEIQESRAKQASAAQIRQQVDSLATWLAANAERGVFLPHSRMTGARLAQSYGLRP